MKMISSPGILRTMCTLAVCALTGIATVLSQAAEPNTKRAPNVIFIATDDLNDWVGPLDSPIKAKTPNLDRLAARGVTFLNAQTSGTYCSPSRAALFTGRHPATTGVYNTQVYWRDHPDLRPLQLGFQQAGYQTYGAGKLFHHPAGFVDLRGWNEFYVRTAAQRTTGWPVDSWKHGAPLPSQVPNSKFVRAQTGTKDSGFLEYAALPDEAEKDMADTVQTDWLISVLEKKHEKPFFAAMGMYAPHYPNYAPKKYYDMYPLNEIQLPPIKDDDSADLPPIPRRSADARKKSIVNKLHELGIMKEAIQAYLACTSFADAQVGRILDALEKSPERDNTIVIFWSDHGYHLGEKGQWGKHTLWKQTAHIPLIWAGPGMAQGAKIPAPVGTIDIYPTLVELCNLAPDKGLEGTSLAPTLRDPSQARDRNVLLCDHNRGGYTLVNQQWRYIHYPDGTEELYQLSKDREEWNNLAGQEKVQPIIDEMKKSAPKSFAPEGPESNKLKLIIEGESFRWEPKSGGRNQAKPKAKKVSAQE
ncbi:MAG: sulfatase [Akkermansiaceae bacterium]|nr:sulfatase [Akkermansiaceae bacterium]